MRRTRDRIGLKPGAAPSDAKTMQCPTCGAPAEPGAFWCDHCATRLRDGQPTAAATLPTSSEEGAATTSHGERVSWRTIGTALLTVVAALAVLNFIHAATARTTAVSPTVPRTKTRPSRASQTFIAPDGSFRVRFPVRPTAIVGGALPVGSDSPLAASSSIFAHVDDRTYALVWADVGAASPAPGSLLVIHCNEAVTPNRKLRSVRAKTVAGQTGVECAFSGRANPAITSKLDVVLVDGARLYSLQTFVAGGVDEREFDEFVASFRLG